jgi:N-methylhydantoinase A/oxoprolinase/acetone carboxylase beta subunit
VAFELARTDAGPLTTERLAALDAVVADLATEGQATLARAGVAEDTMVFRPSLDLRHVGQGHEVTVALPAGRLADLGLDTVRAAFFAQYEAIYGYAHRHLGLEVLTVRLTAQGPAPLLELAAVPASTGAPEPTGARAIYVTAWERLAEVPVYDRQVLCGGAQLHGPCVIEEPDSTAIIGPEVTVQIDSTLNLIAMFQ